MLRAGMPVPRATWAAQLHGLPGSCNGPELSCEDRLKEFFDTKPELEAKCEKLAQMISKARHVIAFTGAGVSTGAGIADFRSGMNTSLPTGPGLWERPKGETPSNILEQCVQARPSPTHGFLFRLWKVGVLKHIISQNVDGLHRKSGITADALSELHGNIFVERCVKCGREYERDFNTICSGGFTGRDCDAPRCGGRLRHSGVGFGDDLPQKVVQKAWDEAEAADLCLALGSSITVTPASEMPAWVAQRSSRRRDAGLVIVNLQATPCDSIAALRINGMVDDVRALLTPCSDGHTSSMIRNLVARHDGQTMFHCCPAQLVEGYGDVGHLLAKKSQSEWPDLCKILCPPRKRSWRREGSYRTDNAPANLLVHRQKDVQEVLQTGTPKDGAIPVAQRLTLEEAEMLAARLAHLSQTAVAVDLSAVQELKRLPRRQSGDSEDSRDVRWAQFTPRQGRQAAPPTAPAVAARVRLRSSPDGSDWISGVVVGHGPPNAPWRCSNGSRQSSVEALLDIVDDQGLLWEQLPPTQVKLPAVQKGSGGTTSMPHGAENRSFLETRRLPPPPPVAREVPPVPFLQPLELPQPPPPPLAQPFIPVGSAQVDEAIVQQIEQEEPPTPVLAVQEQEMMQIEEETPRHRHRRRSRSRSGSRSCFGDGMSPSYAPDVVTGEMCEQGCRAVVIYSLRSRSRTRSRKASENLAHRRFESSSEASGPSHQEEEGAARARQGHSRGRRAADAIDFDKAIGAPMLEISRIATSLRASNEESENKAVQTPRNRAAKGVLADVLRGELPSFARAADSQDPTTLLGHPVALRLGREDLQEDEEAMEAKEAMWLQPPKFQVRLGLPPRKESKALAAPALPADWSLLKTMQFLHDHQSTSMEGKFHEELRCCSKKLQSNHAFPRRAAEKVPLENWFVGYFLETIDAEPAVGDELATNSFDMESFALPPETKQKKHTDIQKVMCCFLCQPLHDCGRHDQC
eukprot:s271_g19.t1